MKTRYSFILGVLLGVSLFFIQPSVSEANFLTDIWNSLRNKTEQVEEEAFDRPIINEDEHTLEKIEKTEVNLYKPVIDYENAVIKAVEKASEAVVSIIVTKDLPVIERCKQDPFYNLPPEIRRYFDFEGGFTVPCQTGTKEQEIGGGSGFIVSADGLVVTNKHVVEDEEAHYTVLTNDGKKYEAVVLARDLAIDLAVIKITASKLPTLLLGDSDSIKLGQTAIAIGNALSEFQNTVSVGVISGKSRTITARNLRGVVETIDGVLQTDAAINPGNSGGPLLNLKGEVIGINTAVASEAQNIGFAIPINRVKKSIDSVKVSGKISTPYLGVRYIPVDEKIAKEEGLAVDYGALISKGNANLAISPGSPAEKYGLKEGDVILEIGGEKVTNKNSLALIIQKHNVGEAVDIKILRGETEFVIRATLEEREG